MGISDLIAGFIQEALDETDGVLELQRSDLAQRFGCVPSQISHAPGRTVEAAADTSASRGCRWTGRRF